MQTRIQPPSLPLELLGISKGVHIGTYTDSREWDPIQENYLTLLMQTVDASGRCIYTKDDIAAAMHRSRVSIDNKWRRLKKRMGAGNYNASHIVEKYDSNRKFYESVGGIRTLLDVFAGNKPYWSNTFEDMRCVTNDIREDYPTDFHFDALTLLCDRVCHKKHYECVDLDPFGSCDDCCIDLALHVATKYLIVTYGEYRHKNMRRNDFFIRHYGISDPTQVTPETFIKEANRIAGKQKKKLVPVIVNEWPNIVRIYYKIERLSSPVNVVKA